MKSYLFIVPSFSSGGAERAVANFSSQLAADGYDVTVVIYFRMKDEYPVDSRVNVINLSGGGEETYNRIPYLQKIKRLRRILKEKKADYILPFLPQTTIHAALAGFDMHGKIIHTIRNNPAVSPANRIKRILCNQIICRSWKTIVQSEKQRAFFPKKYWNKMYILFNPVSGELLSASKNYQKTIGTIIAVGRLEKQKNFRMLIQAMEKVLLIHPNVQLKIYGEGSCRAELQQLINSSGLHEHVALMGRSNHLMEVYQEADLFVMSSDYEGMPNTLIEAMAIGLPCISTDCDTGPSDLITSCVDGLLVPVDRKQAMSDAMIWMIEHPDEAIQMGQKAKESIREKCGIETIAQRLRDICECGSQNPAF